MLGEVLRTLNNWFEVPGKRLKGRFAVEGSALSLPDGWLLEGQYFLVSGSILNDGLHQWPAELKDEEFFGEVKALAVPQAVIDLAARIEEWQTKYGKAAESPYQSQTAQGVSITTKQGVSGEYGWRDAFRAEMNRWRKL